MRVRTLLVVLAGVGAGILPARAARAQDFNGDGFADLAIGVPGESVGSVTGAGAVNVIYGSSIGLTATGNQFWTQDKLGIGNSAEPFDRFGDSLAWGDFNGDGFSDLAIGVPYEDVGSVTVLAR